MKKIITSVLLLALAFGACKKNDTSSTTSVTAIEAADMTAAALSTNSNGLAVSGVDVTANAQTVFDLNLGCGATKTYTATHQSAAGVSPSFSNTFSYGYTLNCNANNQADNITGTISDNGSFNGPRLSATNSGTGNFKVGGLTSASTVYTFNGEYKRTGTFTSKVESKNTSNVTVDVVASNLVINKVTKLFVSGTGTVTITGTTSKNDAINFTGTITFTGDGKATAVIAGSAYVIDLITGDVTKK